MDQIKGENKIISIIDGIPVLFWIILWAIAIFAAVVVVPGVLYSRGIREVIHLFNNDEGSSYYLVSYEGIWPYYYLEDKGEQYEFMMDQARCDHYIYRVDKYIPTEDTRVVFREAFPLIKEKHLPVYPAGTKYERMQFSGEFDKYYEPNDDPEENLITYLNNLAETDYRIYVLIQDEGTVALTDGIMEALSKVGVQTELRGQYRASYIGVFQNNMAVYEELSPDSVLYHEDEGFNMMSGGGGAGFSIAAIWIDGHMVSKAQRGINIVVYDTKTKKIIDSNAVDTYDGLAMTRY